MRSRILALTLALVLGTSAANTQSALPWHPTLDETRDGFLRFEALGGSPSTPVRIGRCRNDACAASDPIAPVTTETHQVPRPADGSRPLFVVERGADRRVIAARRLALEGAFNFRDLGGLRAADGRAVRWGRVFRSDVLSRLTPADYTRLNALGIDLVCDLRGRDERQTAPTVWLNGSPSVLVASLTEDAQGRTGNSVLGPLATGDMSLAQGQQLFEDFYARIAIDSAAKVGHVMRAIASSERPLLVHCTGGRDRTGLIAGLTLEFLGVPRDAIIADYVVSNRFLAEQGPLAPMTGLPPARAALMAQVLELQPRYLQAAFRRIETVHGSLTAYRRDVLGLSDADLERMKARLLQ